MSAIDPLTIHLEQSQLSDKDRDIVRSLEGWVTHAEFDNTNRCKIDPHKWNLLRRMDLVKRFPYPTFQIKRIVAPLTIDPTGQRPLHETEPDAMIVIRVISGNPSATGQKDDKSYNIPLSVGSAIWLRERVQLAPAVDLLLMTSKAASAGH
ncbi:MAG: hypothetical protein Q9182_001836 [Xanthomendoza sp. 2 TL-2023]